MRILPRPTFYKEPLIAQNDGWTKIRNYGDGDRVVYIEMGKRLPRLWRKSMAKLIYVDDTGKEHEIIIRADELSKILNYA